MAEYYYQDAAGQLRGPSTLQVLFALKELGLLTAQTLVQEGVSGVPFPFADLEPKVVAVKPQPLPMALSITSAPIRSVDRWGGMARTYFTLAQIYCFFAAIRIVWRMFFATVELAGHSSTIEHWLTIIFMLNFALFEFCFYGSLFFVFAFVKRRGLRTD